MNVTTNMYGLMKNLISNKYYATIEEPLSKLNVFYAFNILTEKEYSELMELANKVYSEKESETNE